MGDENDMADASPIDRNLSKSGSSKTLKMDDDISDASPHNRNSNNSGENPTENDRSKQNWSLPHVDLNNMYYDMSGKKYLIILNHFKFKRTRHFWFRKPSSRVGTDNDAIRLEEMYQELGFDVKRYDDLPDHKIIQVFEKFCRMDHKETSCVIVAILTHGDKGDKVLAADRPYKLNDLKIMIGNVVQLVGKPKLFFVQACRGNKVDAGKRVKVHGGTDQPRLQTLPTHADFLVMYSTVNDHLSYRNKSGSWLVQALCDVIEVYHRHLDLLHMITLLNQTVAYEYPKRNRWRIKQMPETSYTLTKILRF